MQSQHPGAYRRSARPSRGGKWKSEPRVTKEQEERIGQWSAEHKQKCQAPTPSENPMETSTNTFLTQGSRGVHMDAARTGRAERDARKRREFGRFGNGRRKRYDLG